MMDKAGKSILYPLLASGKLLELIRRDVRPLADVATSRFTMPYVSIEDLPDPVTHSLPKHAQEIFKEAFNSAYYEHENDVDEVRAFKIAWGAVKRTYEKKSGKWLRKSRKGH